MTPEDITYNPRLAGLVARYHTWPTLTTQSVAEHSWQVMRLYTKFFGIPESDVYNFILTHDMGEISTGDVPYPVKSLNPHIKQSFDGMEDAALDRMGHAKSAITERDMRRFKFVHMLEMWEFGLQEVAMGNKFAIPIVSRCDEALQKQLRDWPTQAEYNALNASLYTHMTNLKIVFDLA